MTWLPSRSTQRTTRRSHRLLTVHHNTTYFTCWHDKRQLLEPGPRPTFLGATAPSRRRWESYLALLEQRNPIALADRFAAALGRGSFRTYAQVAERFGVSTPKVCYYLALVTKLPSDFVDWLRTCDDPRVLRCFTERRLRPIARLQDAAIQRARLAEIVAEAEDVGASELAARRPASALATARAELPRIAIA